MGDKILAQLQPELAQDGLFKRLRFGRGKLPRVEEPYVDRGLD